MHLKLYGNLVSQPTRAAAWVLKLKGMAYEFVPVNPLKGEARTPEFLALNPNGMVPVLQHGDFTLFEGNAIMQYLANEHQWTDLYPAKPQARAKVDEYLHWHHTNARACTLQVMLPQIRHGLGKASAQDLEYVKKRDEILGKMIGLLEQFLTQPYLAKTDKPTLADFACYCELGQVERMQVFQFDKFPKTAAWLQRMKRVPFYNDVHEPLDVFMTRFNVNPEYLKVNPNGLVPVIKDGDFTLFEGNAILTYLADKHKWTDLYPTEIKACAKVNEYLHWHHTHARHGTPRVLIPYIHQATGNTTSEDLELIANREKTIGHFVGLIEKFLTTPYLAQSSHLTLADLSCYCELDQLEAMEVFDFSRYPKTAEWMKRMKDVPHHDKIPSTSSLLQKNKSHQPAWVLKLKGMAYEFVPVNPLKGEARTPEFLALNPNGMVPVLQHGDFTLFEGNAIMQYLANEHQWTDLYPAKPQARAKVDEYLHWHHTNARACTLQVMLPQIRHGLGKASAQDLEYVKKRDEILGKMIGLLEQFLTQPYLAKTDKPTLADFACYCELGQVERMQVFQFDKFPKTAAWLQRMKRVPFYNDVHEPLDVFMTRFNVNPVGPKTKI
ncbi:TPA: hypothetical protein N0F65_003809 [Lagenidium giganteum]|uniref:Glutathione transferase n=1 Tax=Lagenidium giganteum TaxID=4803 RepID=A0AAV2Z015_9STRA|nr:TPA: hypothetical protein N0F65_003809 [Lagenidium giganteum]